MKQASVLRHLLLTVMLAESETPKEHFRLLLDYMRWQIFRLQFTLILAGPDAYKEAIKARRENEGFPRTAEEHVCSNSKQKQAKYYRRWDQSIQGAEDSRQRLAITN